MEMTDMETTYNCMTIEKFNSLGQTMTLKEALDLEWKDVAVRVNGTQHHCHKNQDSSYFTDTLNLTDTIKLDYYTTQDTFMHPVVAATLIK